MKRRAGAARRLAPLLLLLAAGCHDHRAALRAFQLYREGAAPVSTLTPADVIEWNKGADALEDYLAK